MTRSNENPLIPASLATDEIQGAKAKVLNQCEAQDIALAASARILARSAIDAARGQLDRYALATDSPAWEVVEAADLLDAAAHCLTPDAEFSDAIKGACRGDA